MKTLGFTGHRPKTLKQYDVEWIELALQGIIERAIKSGYTHFISGGALGVDQLAAEIVLNLKSVYDGLFLSLYIPYPSQHAKWSLDQIKHYEWIKSQSDEVKVLYSDPVPGNRWGYTTKLHARNRQIVRYSDTLVAVWNGETEGKGGTLNCVQVCVECGKKYYHINPADKTQKWRKSL